VDYKITVKTGESKMINLIIRNYDSSIGFHNNPHNDSILYALYPYSWF